MGYNKALHDNNNFDDNLAIAKVQIFLQNRQAKKPKQMDIQSWSNLNYQNYISGKILISQSIRTEEPVQYKSVRFIMTEYLLQNNDS